jgi:hypothetical protein
MKWWRIRNRDADLERALRSDLDLGQEQQRVKRRNFRLTNTIHRSLGNNPLHINV